jgi:hypothetical protein
MGTEVDVIDANLDIVDGWNRPIDDLRCGAPDEEHEAQRAEHSRLNARAGAPRSRNTGGGVGRTVSPVARAVTAGWPAARHNSDMKLPANVRRLTRVTMGMGRAEPIAPAALHALDNPLVIGVGMVRAGSRDPRLPGEQRVASLLTVANVVADVPRSRPIVLHCG